MHKQDGKPRFILRGCSSKAFISKSVLSWMPCLKKTKCSMDDPGLKNYFVTYTFKPFFIL
ncbi:hypothetical protein Dthio_PD2050 [Desulfonatronospira thiodismutans ASO3-1]|uniref:Uncharacterized protein n=1 Tax=Desulfonatronospira thiodismutans ASO3-1 TaxID=555779 RepID=D6SPK2_9BACT|nr:hypothetical protein Dthio_PD2050 [Desulfonatronospira thiodismutans ASO3-1]